MLPAIKPEERAYIEGIFGEQTENFLEQTRTFLALLLEENERHNLIGENTVSSIWQRHILDSLQLTSYLTNSTSEVVIDLGSGGGAQLKLDGDVFNDVIDKNNFQTLAGGKKAMITSRAFKSVAEILAITPDFVEEIVLLKGEKWVEEIEEAQNKNLLGDWQFETAMSITGVGVVLRFHK